MNPDDIKCPADVVRWLGSHVEWTDEASRDMAEKATDVLTLAGTPRSSDAVVEAALQWYSEADPDGEGPSRGAEEALWDACRALVSVGK
jgi:hypothetical protein